MILREFRASRKSVTIQALYDQIPELYDMEFGDEFTHAHIYNGGFYILESRRGAYLQLGCEEYETRDLALLEFLLWADTHDDPQARDIMRVIYGGAL